MKDNYLQIILVLAIFIIPEILKLFKNKKKKYEYPDEQQQYDQDQADTGADRSETLPTDFWDILTGRTTSQEVEQAAIPNTVNADVSVTTTNAEVSPITQPITSQPKSKLSAKSAAKGLIWAEVLGKPRALRPIEREVPYRRSYR